MWRQNSESFGKSFLAAKINAAWLNIATFLNALGEGKVLDLVTSSQILLKCS